MYKYSSNATTIDWNNEDILTNYLLKNLMLKAYYTLEKEYHFGLGLEKYTHWTSPIRRGCD
ncbi:RNB domain-containing ribonuclease, partial [Undibacterium luofuense]|uniref:RNB domain-containing ribonuclease n=1 Tax=Undibacterium luofuense TaxID=2828733 RepID=UPI0030EDE9DD